MDQNQTKIQSTFDFHRHFGSRDKYGTKIELKAKLDLSSMKQRRIGKLCRVMQGNIKYDNLNMCIGCIIRADLQFSHNLAEHNLPVKFTGVNCIC